MLAIATCNGIGCSMMDMMTELVAALLAVVHA